MAEAIKLNFSNIRRSRLSRVDNLMKTNRGRICQKTKVRDIGKAFAKCERRDKWAPCRASKALYPAPIPTNLYGMTEAVAEMPLPMHPLRLLSVVISQGFACLGGGNLCHRNRRRDDKVSKKVTGHIHLLDRLVH